jgi:hypothetical protein
MQCTGANVQQRGSAGFGCNSEPRSGVCSHHLTQRPAKPACCANASQAKSPCHIRQFARSTKNPETTATLPSWSIKTTLILFGQHEHQRPVSALHKNPPAALPCLSVMRMTGLRDLQMKKLHRNAGLFQVESCLRSGFILHA